MASKTTNDGVVRLQQRHHAQLRAAELVAAAAGGVFAARKRRDTELARLDNAVTTAEHSHNVALAVLATLLRDDELAASTAGVDESKVRTARRTVPAEVVRQRLDELGAVPPRTRRRRQPRAAADADG